jgi:T-complex protein 1 subunit gamma
MEVARFLVAKSKALDGVIQGPYRTVANTLEFIPRTIANKCGANTIRTLTALRAKDAEGSNPVYGIHRRARGVTGKLENMEKLGVLEPMVVKLQPTRRRSRLTYF